jgi:hypothetical protein
MNKKSFIRIFEIILVTLVILMTALAGLLKFNFLNSNYALIGVIIACFAFGICVTILSLSCIKLEDDVSE